MKTYNEIQQSLKDLTVTELNNLIFAITEEAKTRNNSRTGMVLFIIHVGNYREVPQLFIKNVPQSVSDRELKNLIEEAGYWFGEFGSKWANHCVSIGLREQRAEVRIAYEYGEVETITYTELVAAVNKLQIQD